MGFLAYLKQADNLISGATITAGAVDSEFPPENLYSMPVSKGMRMNGTGAMKVRLDFPVAVQMDLFSVVAHNLSPSASLLLRGGTTHDPDGTQFQADVAWRRRTTHVLLSASQTFQFWTLFLDDPGNEWGFIQIGLAMMGLAERLDFGFIYGWSLTDDVINLDDETELGTPLPAELTERQILRIKFEGIHSFEGDVVRKIYLDLKRNIHGAYFVPDSAVNEGFFGRFSTEFDRRFGVFRTVETNELTILEDPPGRLLVDPLPGLVSGEVLPAGASYARASAAAYKDSNLILRTHLSNVIRDRHWFAAGFQGILIEPAATNAWNFVRDLSNAAWTKTGVTIVSDAVKGADDVLSADEVREDTATSEHGISRDITGATDLTRQSVAFKFKFKDAPLFRARVTTKAGVPLDTIVNAQTSQIVSSGVPGAFIETYFDGWRRLLLTFGADGGGTTPSFELRLIGPNGSDVSYAGTQRGLYVDMLQLEVDRGWPTSFVDGTRAHGSLSSPFAGFPESLTAYCRYVDNGNGHLTAAGDRRIFTLGLPGTGAYLRLSTLVGNAARFEHSFDGTQLVSAQIGLTTAPASVVELLCHLFVDGSVRISRSIDSGTESVGARSGQHPFAAEWSGDLVVTSASADGFGGVIQALTFEKGVQTMDAMRSL